MEEDDEWELMNPDLSLEIWKLWRSFDFNLDLWPGGVLQWPDWFIHDAAIINWLHKILRQQMGVDK